MAAVSVHRGCAACICLALLVSSPCAWALTGTDLKEICAREEPTFRLSCLMYVGGVSDGLNLAPGFYRSGDGVPNEIICFPEGVRQAVRRNLVVDYLDAHEDQLAFPAEVLIYMALREAWPCPEQRSAMGAGEVSTAAEPGKKQAR